MGFRLVSIDAEILCDMLRYDGIERQETFSAVGLPADAVIVGIDADEFLRYERVTLKMMSAEWPPMLKGSHIDTISINVRTFRFGQTFPTPKFVGRITS